eukprot:CAMPEP_0197464986 /NCGR_PEP_ID=MMETSP1175-20131217/64309_1 /TAXON_ID=1003142 /ORGANISM="Triceratium dubium, Strain CCMP147" /LENGTH=395 /DNA_ID=CAMNT_0043000989 /DNA_START=161 /DNA_END=1346 /DNA_ORIENTATION=+
MNRRLNKHQAERILNYTTDLVVGAEKADDGVGAAGINNLLVHHEAKDAHHGSTAVVKLDAALADLFGLAEGVPAEVNEAIAEVTGEIAGGGAVGRVLHDEELEKANEQDDLSEAGLGDGILAEEGGKAIGVGVEGVALEVDASGKVDASPGHDLAEEGELRDAAVLDLNVPEAVDGAEEADDGVRAAGINNLLVHHEAKDAHHGSTAVVKLDAALADLFGLAEGVPAEVNEAIAEVTGEIAGGGAVGRVLHDEELEKANEQDDLSEAGLGDGILAEEGGKAIGVGVEGVALEVDASGKVDASPGHDLAEEGKLRDAAVLDLDVPEAVEAGLVGVLEEAKGVVQAKRGLGADLVLEGREGSGGLADLGGGEGSGGAGEEGSDGELHLGEDLQKGLL